MAKDWELRVQSDLEWMRSGLEPQSAIHPAVAERAALAEAVLAQAAREQYALSHSDTEANMTDRGGTQSHNDNGTAADTSWWDADGFYHSS